MELISSHDLWLIIRDLRDRVAHEYIPGELTHLYAGIVGTAVPEFRRLLATAERRIG